MNEPDEKEAVGTGRDLSLQNLQSCCCGVFHRAFPSGCPTPQGGV